MNLPLPSKPLPSNAERVFKGVIFDVYQWEQEGYDGQKRRWEKLKRPDSAFVIPVTDDGHIIAAIQEQPGKSPYFQLIGGRTDEGEGALETAKRELLEESGCTSDDWTLFDAFQLYEKIDWNIYTFIAKGCRKIADQKLDPGCEKIDLRLFTFDEFIEAVLSDDCSDYTLKIKFLEAKLDQKKMEELREQLF